MSKPQKCGLFPIVDKKHLQDGILSEYQDEMKKAQMSNILNNVGIMLVHIAYWAMFFFALLNF